jgi:hypothetical protein
MYLDEVKKKAERLLSLTKQPFVPCTTVEIEELEEWVGHCLPAAYREFLLWMGHSGGAFLQGSNCFYNDLESLQSDAKELLEENHFSGELSGDAFVFFMHQGYQFNFFYLSEGDDPPVFLYYEESPVRTSFSQIYARLSEFLLKEMEGHIRLIEEMQVRDQHKKQFYR